MEMEDLTGLRWFQKNPAWWFIELPAEPYRSVYFYCRDSPGKVFRHHLRHNTEYYCQGVVSLDVFVLRCSRSDSSLSGQSYVSVLIRRNERHCTDASCRRLWFVSFSSYCVLTRLPVLPVLERFFSRKERQTLFRSWAGSAGMWLKVRFFFPRFVEWLSRDEQGGNAVWGNASHAPDDDCNATHSHGKFIAFRHVLNADDDYTGNLTAEDASNWILGHTPVTFQVGSKNILHQCDWLRSVRKCWKPTIQMELNETQKNLG